MWFFENCEIDYFSEFHHCTLVPRHSQPERSRTKGKTRFVIFKVLMSRASLSFILLDLKLLELIVTASGDQFLLLWQDQISSLDILACVGSRKLLHGTVGSTIQRDISFLPLVFKTLQSLMQSHHQYIFQKWRPVVGSKSSENTSHEGKNKSLLVHVLIEISPCVSLQYCSSSWSQI